MMGSVKKAVKILQPQMGSLFTHGGAFELALELQGSPGRKIGLLVDDIKDPLAVWEPQEIGEKIALEMEGFREGSHKVAVVILPDIETITDYVIIDVLRPEETPQLPSPLPILMDLHTRPPPQYTAMIHVVILSINLDANSQTDIFVKLAQHLPVDGFTVSIMTPQLSNPSIVDQLTRSLVPIHHIELPPPGSCSSLLGQLRSIKPTDATNDEVPTWLQPIISWLSQFDVALTANTLGHPHTAIMLELARLASRPIRVMELPNTHPPEDLPVQALVAPSLFTANHPATQRFRNRTAHTPPPTAVIFPSALEPYDDFICPQQPADTAKTQPFRVAFVGRLDPIRSPGVFLQVAKEVFELMVGREEQVEFVYVGGGLLETEMKLLAEKLLTQRGRKQVRFVGRLDRREVRCWYNQVDILLNPRQGETFGIVNAEAVAAG